MLTLEALAYHQLQQLKRQGNFAASSHVCHVKLAALFFAPLVHGESAESASRLADLEGLAHQEGLGHQLQYCKSANKV